MRTLYILPIILFLFAISCNRTQETRTVDYSEDDMHPLSIDSILTDTTRVLRAEPPLFFDSTRILIHPIGFVHVDIKNRNKSSFSGSSSYEYTDYGMNIGQGKDDISGSITYLIFEDIDNNKIHPLTKEVLNITNVRYLRTLAKATNRHYLLYRLQDKDTNRDGKINNEDITSLYISKLDGTEFAKLTPDLHQLDEYVMKDWCSRCYFRTMEDVNKDGKFTKKDKYHYFYIDFSSDPYKIVEYNPLDLVLK